MKRLPNTEFNVMRAIWHGEVPVSTAEINSRLLDKTGKSMNMSALQTVLSRLEEKGFVTSEKKGRNRFFTPLITEEDYLADESRSFLERLGGGRLSGLVAAMYECKSISDEDLKELREFIDSRQKGG